jgi:heme exporter protein D
MTDDCDQDSPKRPWRLIADNSLSIALFSLFLACIAAQSLFGWRAYNESLQAAHGAAVSYAGFLATGTFQNAIFSNWQAAMLQLAVLISFSTILRQRGAAHSRKSDDERRADDNGGKNLKADAKADHKMRPSAASRRRLTVNLQFNPLRKRWLYNNSLSLVMFGLFLVIFVLHAWTSNRAYNEEQALRHLAPQALAAYLGSSNFWFNCFQTWEAEFFAIGLYVLLSIFLRQERSPESKKTEASDDDTGDTNE